jgi:D-arabinitol 4-dehydrogenase
MIAPTIRDRLRRGESIESVSMLPALFLAFLQRWSEGGLPFNYQDQAMDPGAAHTICSAPDPITAFASDPTLWGELAGDDRLEHALRLASARVQVFISEVTAP